MSATLDRFENGTLVCALVHYSLAVAHPEECIRVLDKVSPNPKRPWDEIITEARAAHRRTFDAAESAAMREP